MNVKNLFKNLLHDAETLSSEAEQSAETYTDSKFQVATGTGTAASGVASVERCQWVQVGDIVTLTMTFVTASSGVGNTTVFFTGLPKPKNNMLRFVGNKGYTSDTFRLSLQLDGSVANAFTAGTVTNISVEACLTYIADSFVGGVILNLLNALSERGCFA